MPMVFSPYILTNISTDILTGLSKRQVFDLLYISSFFVCADIRKRFVFESENPSHLNPSLLKNPSYEKSLLTNISTNIQAVLI